MIYKGAWIARYPSSKRSQPDWKDSAVLPDLDEPLPFDVLLWQYAENCANGTIDCNQPNPNLADINSALLDKLILPPAT